MKTKTIKNLSRILIWTGLSMILISGVYEASNYPWRLLFANLGWAELQTELPDPPPLENLEPVRSLPEKAEEKEPETTAPAQEEPAQGMPQPPQTIARPAIQVTKLGVIKIPKIGISQNIVEGSEQELYYGVGHVRGTALPGQAGNCVLAGHRNAIVMHPFRHLDKMAEGDLITLSDDEKVYTYEVFSVFEVTPEDVWVMGKNKDEENLLTLLTCTPVLRPVNRLIVWGRLIETADK